VDDEAVDTDNEEPNTELTDEHAVFLCQAISSGKNAEELKLFDSIKAKEAEQQHTKSLPCIQWLGLNRPRR
jgi:hypothetical protein